MAVYELIVRKSVSTDLSAIPKKDLERILARIAALATEPRPPGCEKLSGLERYRLRQGRYRILYEIEDARLTVTVVKVGHRRDVYRAR
jgi:mRNA interferase RelE/StbE